MKTRGARLGQMMHTRIEHSGIATVSVVVVVIVVPTTTPAIDQLESLPVLSIRAFRCVTPRDTRAVLQFVERVSIRSGTFDRRSYLFHFRLLWQEEGGIVVVAFHVLASLVVVQFHVFKCLSEQGLFRCFDSGKVVVGVGNRTASRGTYASFRVAMDVAGIRTGVHGPVKEGTLAARGCGGRCRRGVSGGGGVDGSAAIASLGTRPAKGDDGSATRHRAIGPYSLLVVVVGVSREELQEVVL